MKKKKWIYLVLGVLFATTAYAALDWEITNNTMLMGDGTASAKKKPGRSLRLFP